LAETLKSVLTVPSYLPPFYRAEVSVRVNRKNRLLPAVCGCLILFCGEPVEAGGPRALPEGKLPDDCRLGELRHTGTTRPFEPSVDAAAWHVRRQRLRRQGLVALGLWPMPEKTPLNEVVHGRVERDDYTVDKVYFESYPGHFVTGNLYRPKGPSKGKRAAVLCPYGHWPKGRFHELEPEAVREQIEKGYEKYELGGRCALQARCVGLVRLGCVVFHWDMVGYADSVQLGHRLASRPSMNTPTRWGFVSPQAELRLQTICGLQIYNAMRALDFVSSLPDVDPRRIAVTGASGGGMQTTLLCAFDERPAVSIPAVWVSTTLHGGCTCNMAPYLRIDEGNVGWAALIAPRPLLLIGANDWTVNIDTQGYPDLQRHFALLGHRERVACRVFREYPHNYNYGSRAVMYSFVNRQLDLGHDEPIVERDFQPLSIAEMSVWDDEHKRPAGDAAGAAHERALLEWITRDSQRQMKALVPHGAQGLAEFRRIVGGAVDVMIGRCLPEPSDVKYEQVAEKTRDGYREAVGLLSHTKAREQLPVLLLQPTEPTGKAVVWVHASGKGGLLDESGLPRRPIRRLLRAGVTVLGVDLLYQGEFLPDQKAFRQTRISVDSKGTPNTYPSFTFSFNLPVFAQRVHDVLTAVSFLRGREKTSAIYLVGCRGAGHWVAAARAQIGDAVVKAAVDTGGFRFAKLDSVRHPDFLPGGAKYHDLPGMLALSAPDALWVAGEDGDPPSVTQAAYEAAASPEKLTLFSGGAADTEDAAVNWLLE